MDLNRLYFDHQLSEMRASAAPTRSERRAHEARSRRFAALIIQIRASLNDNGPILPTKGSAVV